jgi:predicted dehydrogenase
MAIRQRSLEAVVNAGFSSAGTDAVAQPESDRRLVARCRRIWDAAAGDFPCIIVGMGRWGRVLASVICKARGSGAGLHLLARSNPGPTSIWANSHMPAATVCSSFDELMRGNVMSQCANGGFAIVASEPARHLADWSRLHAAGLPVLVEKPLAANLDEVDVFSRQAASKPATGVGIEFAMLPVWAFLRARLNSPIDDMAIRWGDPAGEVRHGAIKRRHDGVSLVADLSYHIASILNCFCPVSTIRVEAMTENTPQRASFELSTPDVRSIRVDLAADAPARQRTFTLRSGTTLWEVDFGESVPGIRRNGKSLRMPPELAAFDSSLRLEIGAFYLRTQHEKETTPITEWLKPCAALHRLLVGTTGHYGMLGA